MAHNPKIQQIIETIREAGIAERDEVAALVNTLETWDGCEVMGRTITLTFPEFVDAIIRQDVTIKRERENA